MKCETLLFSDDAWFHISGLVNSQNYTIWSGYIPHHVVEVTLHPFKLHCPEGELLVESSSTISKTRFSTICKSTG
jgi:hypothetical protein